MKTQRGGQLTLSDAPRDPEPSRHSGGARGVWVLPPAVVLALSLLGSLGVHLPIYAGLGVLAQIFRRRPSPADGNHSIVLTMAPLAEADLGPLAAGAEERALAAMPEERPERRELAPPAPEREQRVVPELRRWERRPPPPRDLDERRPPPPRDLDERRAIVQRTRDPSVEAPPDARFIAEEANDVEEETVARVTDTQRDDPDPTAALRPDTPQRPDDGDGDEQVAADLREERDDDRRVGTPTERERDPSPAREASASREVPQPAGASEAGAEREVPPEQVARAERGGYARGGGDRPPDELLVHDGTGSFVVRVARESVLGEGGGEAGGRRVPGLERGGGDAARERLARSGAWDLGSGVRVGLSWTEFEAMYGEEDLRLEREARLQERRPHSRGGSRQERWEQFRAAIENYVPEVRPGNQTALDAAASPFARFLSDMHRRIHSEFADRYLASLDLDSPESDPSLATTLEIAVNPDGTLHRVGVVATSGNILFDFGAWNSVIRAQPFPPPPSVILSGDGHAWLHWRFDRGPRQCGTWNARPFLLDNAPLIDRGEPPPFSPGVPSRGGEALEEG
jgi:hypothetical protein